MCLYCDTIECINIICTLFLSFCFILHWQWILINVGVDHDNIILLSTTFPTIPMFGTHCCCNVILYYVGNKRCCIALYCIESYSINNVMFQVSAVIILLAVCSCWAGELGCTKRGECQTAETKACYIDRSTCKIMCFIDAPLHNGLICINKCAKAMWSCMEKIPRRDEQL